MALTGHRTYLTFQVAFVGLIPISIVKEFAYCITYLLKTYFPLKAERNLEFIERSTDPNLANENEEYVGDKSRIVRLNLDHVVCHMTVKEQ